MEHRRENYPIPADACLVSKGVTVFRGTEKDGYYLLPKPFPVTMISCAAVSRPRLTSKLQYLDPKAEQLMQLKIFSIVEAAVQAGCDATVLSAFGCGAFGNPPHIIAQIFKRALELSPIQKVFFCIMEDHNAGGYHNARGNFKPFQEVFGLG